LICHVSDEKKKFLQARKSDTPWEKVQKLRQSHSFHGFPS
jgi:hypothetical protein